MSVVDASAVIELLLRTAKGRILQRRLLAPGHSLNAPHLIDVEVAQVMRRYVRLRDIDEVRARANLELLAALPLRRYAHGFLMKRVWELRDNFTACDAMYLALAEALNLPLVTCDAKLASGRHTAKIELA
jgi:predicted nucleic acid-binding protein